jgi:hypothetical protein
VPPVWKLTVPLSAWPTTLPTTVPPLILNVSLRVYENELTPLLAALQVGARGT